MRRALTPALLSLAVAVSAAAGSGHLVLNGGGGRPREVMEKFVELAGGPSSAIVVVPTASGEPDTGGRYVDELVREYGCTDVASVEIRSREDAFVAALVERIAAARGIFFTGGDQRRIVDAFVGTPAGEALSRAFAAGAVIGGSSAGTACQSPQMITGDGDATVIEEGSADLVEGLGLFGGVIVDQHFVARQRQNRLIAAVLANPELLGVGVDEETAVWVRPDGTFEVLGEGWVMVLDASPSTVTRRQGDGGRWHLGVHDLKVHLLQPGELFDLGIRAVVSKGRESRPTAASERHQEVGEEDDPPA